MGEVNYKNLTIILLIVGIGILAIAIFGVGGISDLVKRIKPPKSSDTIDNCTVQNLDDYAAGVLTSWLRSKRFLRR
jgi:hypothetical protein